MKCFSILLLLFATSCDAQHPNQYSIPPIPPQTDRTPRTVEYRDHVHLVFLSGFVLTHAIKTGMVPENIKDDTGKPLLSWRVMLLKYGNVEEVALYKKFKLDEPWDSEHNKKVAEDIPEYYMDPAGTKFTPYLGVSGKTAAFADKPRPIDGIRKQNSVENFGKFHAAIVTVDTSKVKVFWTEPKDVPLEKIEDNVRWYMNRILYTDTEGAIREWVKDKKPPSFEFE